MTINDIPSAAVLIDADALERNIVAMQTTCERSGVALWPHIKTHKCVEILRMQLRHGAEGITCAKIGEAEAMLASGVRKVFLAHSLVDVKAAPRLRALSEKLERLVLAATSRLHAEHLERVAAATGLRFPVFAALDTGLGREGSRSLAEFDAMIAFLEKSRHLDPVGIYTHEGHFYRCSSVEEVEKNAVEIGGKLKTAAGALPEGSDVAPGCSVSAARLALVEGITMIRPGAYLLGDLNLAYKLPIMAWQDCAATILATVVDRPEKDLAIIDAGSKSFSGDKNANGESGRELNDPDIVVAGVNEEHGYVRGTRADALRIGDRLRFVPNHICPVMNLTDRVWVVRGEDALDSWKIEGRGMVS